VSWFSRKDIPVTKPWMREPFVVNDKIVDLQTLRDQAVEMRDGDAEYPWEIGMAHTIIALVDEVDRLQMKAREEGRP
jgi:hypothetical protein